jgi:hypothetical protein
MISTHGKALSLLLNRLSLLVADDQSDCLIVGEYVGDLAEGLKASK